MPSRIAGLVSALLALTASVMLDARPPEAKRSIAHRGASAYAPEHTLAAYELAISQGADDIEQDLGVTRDGVLVCIHDSTLERTTDIETVFPDRASGTGEQRRWLVADFTFAEIQRLDAGSWFDPRFAGQRVPSWQQAIDLVRGRAGLVPELKDPQLYRDRGHDPAALLLEALRRNGLAAASAEPRSPIAVQSFDIEALQAIAAGAPTLSRIFLIEQVDAARWLTAEGLMEVKRFATGIGPAKGALDGQPHLVRLAHAAGLTVSPWTFRSRSHGRFTRVGDEMAYYLYDLGVDAVFTDNPDQFPRR